MPTVDRLDGIRIVIYPNDHVPAHIHAIGKGCEAVFKLHCPNGPVELRENQGSSKKDLTKIEKHITENLSNMCAKWRQIHG